MGGERDTGVGYSCDHPALTGLRDMVDALNSRLAEKRGRRDAGVLIGHEVGEIDDFCLLGRILGKIAQWTLKHEWEFRHGERGAMTDRERTGYMLQNSPVRCAGCDSANLDTHHEDREGKSDSYGSLYWWCNDCGSTGVARTRK